MARTHIEPTAEGQQVTRTQQGMTAWDRTAIIMLGAAGFAFSFDALRQVAIAIHASETMSYLFPIFIDGFIGYSVRAILLLRHQSFSARAYVWFLFLTATGASLGVNALHAVTMNRGPESGRSTLHLADGVVGVLSTLAPLALAGSVHLYILMARTAELSVRDDADGGPGPVREAVRSPAAGEETPERHSAESGPVTEALAVPSTPSVAVPAVVDLRKSGTRHVGAPGPGSPAVPPSAAAAPADEGQVLANGRPAGVAEGEMLTPSPAADEAPAAEPVRDRADGSEPSVPDDAELPQNGESLPSPAAAETPVPEPGREHADGGEPPVPDDAELPQDRDAADDEWLEELLPVAWTAYRESGRISRDAIKEAVRAHQPISNDRMGLLLARLKDEVDQRAAAPAGASGALW
ncbi:DUF2637 domain-containing protein [Streptomyces sp. CBMA123]|uniref:DUF2637 domain-containing protein n=1 Tax=Streptomyces sp. CBMA123 TaxID=1896313 RepID=UPI001CB8351C|nr:DUF2637 domain-containing protein [Streptomyces sp. CBMA123]MBD0689397.1 hypothetical protein [Streptomyces sp. CBMA123]